MKIKNNLLKKLVAFAACGMLIMTGEVQADALSGPSVGESGLMEFDTVYSGEYPQSEVTGTELTEDIVNADYDEDGIATIDNIRYTRVHRLNTAAGTYGYFRFEPIAWRVINMSSGVMLLQSEKGISCRQYNAEKVASYEESDLRSWLNDDFLNTAFDTDISDQFSPADDNIDDLVTILSDQEVVSEKYGMNSTSSRAIQMTDYAQAEGAEVGHVSGGNYGTYWTRNVTNDAEKINCVNYIGNIDVRGVTDTDISVVPVIKLHTDGFGYTEDDPTLSKPMIDKENASASWDTVLFGQYPQSEVTGDKLTASICDAVYQDNITSVGENTYKRVLINGSYHYYLFEPIKWRILDFSNDELILQSDMILDLYDGSDSSGRYKESKLYSYMNEDFYDMAFDSAEKTAICQSTAGMVGLTDNDITNESYGFISDKTRVMENTDYVYQIGNSIDTQYGSPYWIYSQNEDPYLSGYVNGDGICNYSVFSGVKGVIPVIHIKKYPYVWSKGTVRHSSEKNDNSTNGSNNGGNNQNTVTASPAAPAPSYSAPVPTFSPVVYTKQSPKGLKITSVNATSQKISWGNVNGVKGYLVYRSTSRSGVYRYIGTTSNNYYVAKGLKKGKTYFYAVRGYRIVNSMIQYTGTSTSVKGITGYPAKPVLSITKKKKKVKTTVNLRWKGVSDAKYIQIYRYSGKGKYKKLLDTSLKKKYKKGANISYTSSHGVYRFKVRTYNIIGKKRYYSVFSTIKKVRL